MHISCNNYILIIFLLYKLFIKKVLTRNMLPLDKLFADHQPRRANKIANIDIPKTQIGLLY